MAQYTSELRTIVDAGINVFDFDYPKMEGVDYPAIEKQFIDRYYFNEIGVETVDRFKKNLETMWNASINGYSRRKLQFLKHIDEIEVMQTSNMKTSTKNEQTYHDTPINSTNKGNPSNISDGNGEGVTSGFAGATQIELLENYYDHYRDLDDEFIDKFGSLFMGVL